MMILLSLTVLLFLFSFGCSKKENSTPAIDNLDFDIDAQVVEPKSESSSKLSLEDDGLQVTLEPITDNVVKGNLKVKVDKAPENVERVLITLTPKDMASSKNVIAEIVDLKSGADAVINTAQLKSGEYTLTITEPKSDKTLEDLANPSISLVIVLQK